MYGKELVLDLHGCDVETMTRESLTRFFVHLCELIEMKRGDLHFWDDEGVPEAEKQTDPKTTGVSAVQFILTSSIVVHCLTLLGSVYVNVFSCKDFDTAKTRMFIKEWFHAKRVSVTILVRT